MSNKGIFYNMGGWAQLFFLCFLFFSGLMLASFAIISSMNFADIAVSAPALRLAQTIQAIGIFLLPALTFASLCEPQPRIYLKTESVNNIPILLLAILLLICIQPLINALSYYNEQLVLTDFFSSVQNWIKEHEESSDRALQLLFADKSIVGLISNILVIAIVAPLAEEFFFRGVLQQIIKKIVQNKHIAVWITAIIFSAIHMEFYGFFPRMMLGAILGYLFVWSNNIWVPVIVHTFHNALNVILAYVFYGTPEYEQLEQINVNNSLWIVLLSVVLSVIILIIIYRKSITNSNN